VERISGNLSPGHGKFSLCADGLQLPDTFKKEIFPDSSREAWE